MSKMDEKLTIWTYAILLSTVSYISPVIPILLTVGTLVSVDTVLGVWVAIKRKHNFSWEKFGLVAAKMLIYQMVLLTLFLVEQNIWGNWIAAVKIAAGAIAVVEVISILENSGIILGQPVFKFLINKLGSKSNK